MKFELGKRLVLSFQFGDVFKLAFFSKSEFLCIYYHCRITTSNKYYKQNTLVLHNNVHISFNRCQ